MYVHKEQYSKWIDQTWKKNTQLNKLCNIVSVSNEDEVESAK